MAHNCSSSEDSSRTAERGISRSGKFAVAIVVVYASLFTGLLWGGFVGNVLYVGLLSSAFWAVYIAGPLAVVLWVGFIVRRLFAPRGQRSILRAGLKSAVIVFGTIGLVLWTVAVIPPGARTFSSGYWIHAKLWVDVDEIRTWAAGRTASVYRFTPIPVDQWPASLRRLAVSGGVVTCNPKNLTVIFYEGGDYGHWGLTVARPGTQPPDDRHAIELEDGVWVWRE